MSAADRSLAGAVAVGGLAFIEVPALLLYQQSLMAQHPLNRMNNVGQTIRNPCRAHYDGFIAPHPPEPTSPILSGSGTRNISPWTPKAVEQYLVLLSVCQTCKYQPTLIVFCVDMPMRIWFMGSQVGK